MKLSVHWSELCTLTYVEQCGTLTFVEPCCHLQVRRELGVVSLDAIVDAPPVGKVRQSSLAVSALVSKW